MNYDEFGFFNQQLGTMLRDGIPLEGALRQLCENMRGGSLRSELELLEADLKQGKPLATALAPRKLPDFYKQMLNVGVQGNDLPGVLTMLADYYQQVDSIWTRLKGLMVYPFLVLVAAFVLSSFITYGFAHLFGSNFVEVMGVSTPGFFLAAFWAPPVLIGLLIVVVLVIALVPSIHRRLRWRLPAFKDAKLAQVASAMWVMLKGGGNLDDALGLVQRLEKGTPASTELAQWKDRLSGGRGQFGELAVAGKAFPPMFLWQVGNAGEDLATGFRRAAETYHARAVYRAELFLFSALPIAILALGTMIACQMIPVVSTLAKWMSTIE